MKKSLALFFVVACVCLSAAAQESGSVAVKHYKTKAEREVVAQISASTLEKLQAELAAANGLSQVKAVLSKVLDVLAKKEK